MYFIQEMKDEEATQKSNSEPEPTQPTEANEPGQLEHDQEEEPAPPKEHEPELAADGADEASKAVDVEESAAADSAALATSPRPENAVRPIRRERQLSNDTFELIE